MVVIGLGANLGTRVGRPHHSLAAAVRLIERSGFQIARRSPLYVTAPVPPSAQPMYVNAVIAVVTSRTPQAVLRTLKTIERRFGRSRAKADAARVLDLDLLDMSGRVVCDHGPLPLTLPHARLASRAFVLRPLLDVMRGWRHPVSGEPAKNLLKSCASDGRFFQPWRGLRWDRALAKGPKKP